MHKNTLHIFIVILLICLVYLIYNYKKINEHFTETKWDSNTELIIVSAHYNEDLNWLLNAPVPVVVCGKEGEKDAAIPSNPKCKTINEGNEASSYIKFIVEYYDNLPEYILFIHGHEIAHHQKKNIFDEIRARKWYTKNYYSVNKFGLTTAMNHHKPIWEQLEHLWDIYFRPYLHRDCPKKIVCDCCAQFIISRNAIHKYPKEVYIKWLNLLLNDYKYHDNAFEPNTFPNGKQMAIIFEYIWHIIFGEPDEMTEL